jgi:hypothetical protein
MTVAACGSSNSVDQGELEDFVVSTAPANLEAESASCPDDVSSDKGTTFECTLTTATGEGPVPGEITSEGEDDVNAEFDYSQIESSGATGESGAS